MRRGVLQYCVLALSRRGRAIRLRARPRARRRRRHGDERGHDLPAAQPPGAATASSPPPGASRHRGRRAATTARPTPAGLRSTHSPRVGSLPRRRRPLHREELGMSATDRLVTAISPGWSRSWPGIPRAGRREMLDEVRGHIADAAAGLSPEDETGIRNVLERLGDPSEIAAEARERFGVRSASSTILARDRRTDPSAVWGIRRSGRRLVRRRRSALGVGRVDVAGQGDRNDRDPGRLCRSCSSW